MSYQFKAVDRFWKNFYALDPDLKEATREAWKIFKTNPFDPRLRSHKINALSGLAGTTIYSAAVAADLRVIFRVDGEVVTTLDIGSHAVYG